MKKLTILWTNADIDTSKHMVMMYAKNAKKHGWWDEITVVVWGATSKLLAYNEEIQAEVKELEEVGVEVSACIACAKALDTYDAIAALGIEMIPWGIPLTEIIQQEGYLITV